MEFKSPPTAEHCGGVSPSRHGVRVGVHPGLAMVQMIPTIILQVHLKSI